MCSSSSRYTEESLCGCNTTPYFTLLWVCRGIEVFPAIPGKGVPYVCVYILFSHSNTDVVLDGYSYESEGELLCSLECVCVDVTKLQNIQDTTHCGCFVNLQGSYVSVCSYLRWRCPLFYLCMYLDVIGFFASFLYICTQGVTVCVG